jgi:hypothetical protein
LAGATSLIAMPADTFWRLATGGVDAKFRTS